MRRKLAAVLATTLQLSAPLGGCSGEPGPPSGPAQGTISLATSTVSAAPNVLPGDGQSTATITVSLVDNSGNPYRASGGPLGLRAAYGRVSAAVDEGNGAYRAVYTAPAQTGGDVITATLAGQLLTNQASVELLALTPSAAKSYWLAEPNWLPPDGQSSATVFMFFRDANGWPAVASGVTMTTTRGALSAATPNPASGSSIYFATLTASATVDTAAIGVFLNGVPFDTLARVRFDVHHVWKTQASLSSKRMSLALGEVNGSLYALGGDSSWLPGSWLGRVDAYDPAANSWTSRSAMPTPRSHLAVASVGGTLFAIGGRNATNLNTVEAYDPSADAWSAKSAMPTPRGDLGIAVINGVVYAVGGRALPSGASLARTLRPPQSDRARPPGDKILFNDTPTLGAVRVMEAYDPASDRWTSLAPMPTSRGSLAVAVINGILYAVGGSDASGALNVLEAYDPGADRWTTKAPMPEARDAVSVAVLGGKLYVIGGYYAYREQRSVQVYDPATDAWTRDADLLVGRLAGASIELNGVIYAVGGACYDDVLVEMEAYVP